MVAYTCRLLTVDDAKIFRELRLEGVQDTPSAFLESYEDLLQESAEQYKRRFKNGWIAGAFVEDKLIACAGLFRHIGSQVAHKGKVWGVYTAPQARGHGIARKLITMVIEEAQKAGIELVMISTNEKNPVTMYLYQSLGFNPCGMEPHILKLADGSYIDDVLMVKFL